MEEKLEKELLRDIRLIKSLLEGQILQRKIDRDEIFKVIFMLNSIINFYFQKEAANEEPTE